MTSRNFAISFIAFYVTYNVYYKLVLDPLDRAGEEAMGSLSDKELDEMDLGKAVFIPFPGTIKQLPPKPYRGSDPEWQEFIKFSKDQGQHKRVRGETS